MKSTSLLKGKSGRCKVRHCNLTEEEMHSQSVRASLPVASATGRTRSASSRRGISTVPA